MAYLILLLGLISSKLEKMRCNQTRHFDNLLNYTLFGVAKSNQVVPQHFLYPSEYLLELLGIHECYLV